MWTLDSRVLCGLAKSEVPHIGSGRSPLAGSTTRALPGNWTSQTQVSVPILMPLGLPLSASSNSPALGVGSNCEADRCFPVKQFREATACGSGWNGTVSNTAVILQARTFTSGSTFGLMLAGSHESRFAPKVRDLAHKKNTEVPLDSPEAKLHDEDVR
jgi:hypothetical protein